MAKQAEVLEILQETATEVQYRKIVLAAGVHHSLHQTDEYVFYKASTAATFLSAVLTLIFFMFWAYNDGPGDHKKVQWGDGRFLE